MSQFEHKFNQGLMYGQGLMQVRFERFFFLLRNMLRLQRHLGVTDVHAWYDPKTKNSFVLNVVNANQLSASFRLLIAVVQIEQKLSK